MSLIKTYGAKGFMEWKPQIKVGHAIFNFTFSGGTLTGYGVTPALYTTDNKVYQAVIENSDYFKQGKIILVRQVNNGDGENSATSEALDYGKTMDNKEIEVKCIEDARQILIDEYGVQPMRLTSKKSIMDTGKANGVKFVIAKSE